MKVGVIGTGYVGLVTGACLAEIGNDVICQDLDGEKIAVLNDGNIPIYEPYLEELVTRNVSEGRLSFTSDIKEAIYPSEVIFICVGTPPLGNGEADLSAVENVAKQIAIVSDSYKLVTEKSTVPIQTGTWIEKTLEVYNKNSVDFDVSSNPEFLREGNAVEDFLHPARVVIGVENERAEKTLRKLYAPILSQNFRCPIHTDCSSNSEVPLVVTDINSAELIKHVSNSFLATKISFINAVADICEKAGADVSQVAYGVGLDPRIGKEFLNAGIGFGGFCFPKDLQAFIRIAEKLGYDFSLLKEVERINENRVEVFLEKIKSKLWIIKDKTIGVLGLSFKPNTDDIRFAPSLKIISTLQKEGAIIKAYDPKAMDRTREIIPDIIYAHNPYETAEESEALLLITEWDDFRNLDFNKIKSLMRRPLIVDGRNMLDKQEMLEMGFEYLRFGN